MRGRACQKALYQHSNGEVLGRSGDDVEREEEKVLTQNRSIVEIRGRG